ncbi:MAG: hypothetical protein E2O79_09950 [Caldithrix sp.]|nr:MAG: hypothetical protein E2O79_09950 [Caldithrix sp.]
MIDKLERKYNKAWSELVKERNRLYPPGTKVRCKITGLKRTVTKGSLYADQIFLDGHTHSSWRHVEIIKESGAIDSTRNKLKT